MHLIPEDLASDQEGEQHLVVFKETSTDVQEHEPRDVVDQDGNPCVHVFTGLGLPQALLEERDEELETVLVHRVDLRQVGHDEVQDRGPGGDGPQFFADGVDLCHGLVGDDHPLLALASCLLGLIQGLVQAVVLQNVALRVCQQPQDELLKIVLCLLVGSDLHDQLLALLREIGPLAGDDLGDELVVQAQERYREVDDRHFDADLGQVVRVRHLRGDKEAEVVVVWDVLRAQAQQLLPPPLEDGLGEHRLDCRVKHLLNILDQHGMTIADRRLQLPQVDWVGQLGDIDVLLLAHVANPAVRLALWVDHEWPASATGDHDAVLDGQVVGRQAGNVPLPHLGRVDEHVVNLPIGVRLQAEGNCLLKPCCGEVLAELGGEGAGVGDEASRQQDVPDDKAEVLFQDRTRRVPADGLVAQTAQQLLGAVQLEDAVLGIGLELIGLGLCTLQLCLKRGDIVEDDFQLCLLDGQLLIRLILGRLGRSQLQLLRLDLAGNAAVDVHRLHPQAERQGGVGDLLNFIWHEVFVLDVLLKLRCQLWVASQRVLVVVLQIVQELGIVHLLLRIVPRLLRPEKEAHGVQHQLDNYMRLREGLHLRDVLLVKCVQRLDGGVVLGQCLVQVLLAVRGDFCGRRGGLGGDLCIDGTSLGLLVGDGLVRVDLDNERSGVLLRLLDGRLHGRQLDLQVVHDLFRLAQGLRADDVAVQLRRQLAALFAEHVREEADQLQV
mmetsp:Transcript_175347/g.562465  ORF Transcript_175347/g.562465 Transcript_175347/m.562465 type:complete len:721 (+) Transcript_175347:2410-4572(+)